MSPQATWRLMAILLASFGAFSGLVLWVVLGFVHPPTTAIVAAALAVLVPIVFALFCLQRARACAADRKPSAEK
jgi:hypothetical protein